MRFLIVIILALGFIACKKENLLEDTILVNVYDQVIVNYITVDSVSPVACDVLIMNFTVHTDRIPDTLQYTHFLIKDTKNNAQKSVGTKRIYVASNCNLPTTYYLTLYNEKNKNESAPSLYTYEP